MSRDDFMRVGSAALNSIESLLSEWLPNGVREGREWCIGSRDGESGKSMKVCLAGDAAGVWSDFSADDSGSDLISLYAYIHRMEQVDAMKAVAASLGIDVVSSARERTAPAQAVPRGKEPVAKKPRTAWVTVLPVPVDAPAPPAAHMIRGMPAMQWRYTDQAGALLGMVYRFTTSDGGKEVLPCVYARHPETGAHDWRWMGFPEPRPLYLTTPLRDDVVVLVVEGEKCADAGFALLSTKLDVVSWQGGSKAIAKTDWSLLAGRRVILWPDADEPGAQAMAKLAAILLALGCAVKMVVNPDDVPEGWDIADAIADGVDVRALLSAAVVVSAPEAETISAPVPAGASGAAKTPSWTDQLIYKRASTALDDCRENVMMMLTNDPLLKGVVGLNEFSMLQVKRIAPPWGSDLGEWNEGDDFELGTYIAKNYGVVIKSDAAIEKAVAHAARLNRFNPVTDYLRGLAWDGVPRLHTWVHQVMGATDTEYHALVGSLFMLSMVARAFQPGCQMDTAPVFEGGQGEGKSSAMRILGGDWYSETPFKIGDKDGYLAIQGVWLYEIAELDSFNRAETTGIKAFMSNLNDRFRAPYGRRMIDAPRRTCFCGTTNQDEYFKDTTGNRRFLPVACGLIDLATLKKIRDQLFAEAVHLYDAGSRWYPTKEESRILIEPQQEQRELEDVWKPRLFRYVQGIAESESRVGIQRLNEVTAEELLTKALHIEIGKISAAKGESMRISVIMKKMGWVKKRRSGGAREWFYLRGEGALDDGDVNESV